MVIIIHVNILKSAIKSQILTDLIKISFDPTLCCPHKTHVRCKRIHSLNFKKKKHNNNLKFYPNELGKIK